jgi:putative PIN family toxin of toxin-antitoxin system
VRVFLDTNVLASAVATRGICADVLQTALAHHEVVVSEQVLAELRRALQEKFRTSAELAKETVRFLRREAEVVGEAPKLEITVRDQDDAAIVEQAVAGGADVLVTGDRDLIEMGEDRPIPILTPRGFWDLLRSDSAESE